MYGILALLEFVIRVSDVTFKVDNLAFRTSMTFFGEISFFADLGNKLS